MTTLLEKAKKVPVRVGSGKYPTPEKVELALAWIQGEVGITQVHKVLKLRCTSDAYVPLATGLKQALKNNLIHITKAKG